MLTSYIAFDVETTGLNPLENEIIEIGALKVRDGKVAERFMEFIKPAVSISPAITSLTGITNEMVAGARSRCSVVSDFLDFCEEDVLIGHNILFDYSFMKVGAAGCGKTFERYGIDTLKIARKVHQELESKSLENLCAYYHIENKSAHRAYHDALATAKLYQTLAHYFEKAQPKVFQPVQLSYRQKKVYPATQRQISFLTNLIHRNRLEIQMDPQSLTRSEASKMIDQILNGQNKGKS